MSHDVNRRYRQHMYSARKRPKGKVHEELLKLIEEFERPLLEIVEQGVATAKQAARREMHWISYLGKNHDLWNEKRGGDGIAGVRRSRGRKAAQKAAS